MEKLPFGHGEKISFIKQIMYTKSEKTNIENKILAKRIQLLHRFLPVSLFANFVCASVIFVGLHAFVNIFLLSSWYIAVILISFLRFLHSKWYLLIHRSPVLNLNIFIVGTALAAAMWGIAGSLLMPHNSYLCQMVIIVIIAGVTAGGLQTLQSSAVASSIFVTLAILPLAIWLLLQGGTQYTALGIAMSTYLFFMLAVAQRNYKLLMHVLNLRYENAELVKSLALSNNKLKFMASHDLLTGLPNRGYFDELFMQALERAKRVNKQLAVIFIDLDHFKTVNDIYGHTVGDELLAKVAKRLRKNVRATDVVARLSGDEFVLFLENIEPNQSVNSVVETVLKRISQSFLVDKHQIFVTTSMGISVFPKDGGDEKTLLKNADVALYRAKTSGRNKYEFFSDSPRMM